MPDQRERIATMVKAFDDQGWHRTGTDVDALSAEWLSMEMEALGLPVLREPYSLSRITVEQAFIRTDGRTIEGLPLFDGGVTDAVGVHGRIGPFGSDAAIGIVDFGVEAASQTIDERRRSTHHQALVAITAGGRPGLMARNATYFNHPFGVPVLQVSSEERAFLEAAGAGATEAALVARVQRVPSQSSNVIAQWRGSDSDMAPVMVTTPRSGWWRCAGERGGGIAAWAEVARVVVTAEPARPVWFVAFSGHELGHLGSNAFLAHRPELVRAAKAWVHLGANVGGAVDPGVRIAASDEALLEAGRSALVARSVTGIRAAPAGTMLGLESEHVHASGGRVLALLGGNAHFHLQSDRWPDAVDATSIAVQANAIADLVLQLVGPVDDLTT